MPLRCKGGITNDKKYFSGNTVEKVLTTVKNCIKRADTSSKSINPYVSVSHRKRILVNILRKEEYDVLCKIRCQLNRMSLFERTQIKRIDTDSSSRVNITARQAHPFNP